MKLLISTFFTLLIAVEVQAQKPDLVPLMDIFGQVADEAAESAVEAEKKKRLKHLEDNIIG